MTQAIMTPGNDIFQEHREKLLKILSSDGIALCIVGDCLVGDFMQQEALDGILQTIPKAEVDKAQALYTAVRAQVNASPKKFEEFLTILRNEEVVGDTLAEELEKIRNEIRDKKERTPEVKALQKYSVKLLAHLSSTCVNVKALGDLLVGKKFIARGRIDTITGDMLRCKSEQARSIMGAIEVHLQYNGSKFQKLLEAWQGIQPLEDIVKEMESKYKAMAVGTGTSGGGPELSSSALRVVKVEDKEDYCVVRVGDEKNEENAYKMNTVTHHGLALIISITEFDRSPERNYGKVDEDRLVDLFGTKFLGYKTLLLKNLTAEEILLALELATGTKKFSDIPPKFQSSLSDFSNSSNAVSEKDDSFILAIMTHGKNGIIQGSDSKDVHEDNILKIFECPLLLHKPKIFFLQACRGNDSKEEDTDTADVELTDFVLQYSTYSGAPAYALDFKDDPEKQKLEGGTWFVYTLQNTFKEMYNRYDLEEMLQEVGKRVQKIRVGRCEQCPVPVYQLNYKLFFKID